MFFSSFSKGPRLILRFYDLLILKSLFLPVCVGSLHLHYLTGSAFVIIEKRVNVCLPIHIKVHTGRLHLPVMEGN